MTIKFNNGVDPDEVKFNGQDMETVKADGVTVWEKLSGTQYRITSDISPDSSNLTGWLINSFGSITPFPADFMISVVVTTSSPKLRIQYAIDANSLPNRVRFNGVIYNLSSFSSGIFGVKTSETSASSLLPLYNSLFITGNNTTFELIYP